MLYVKKRATTDTTIFLLWVLHQTYCALHVVFVFWGYEINENTVVENKSVGFSLPKQIIFGVYSFV